MSDPVFVGPANLATVKPEDVADLIEDLRDAGFDARLAHHGVGGAGPEVFDTVVVWVAESAGEAAIGAAVTLGIQWMRKRFRSSPRKKSVYVNIYENDSGDTVRIIEMSAPDEEPMGRYPAGAVSVSSSAARSPRASSKASSLAQKCM